MVSIDDLIATILIVLALLFTKYKARPIALAANTSQLVITINLKKHMPKSFQSNTNYLTKIGNPPSKNNLIKG